MSGEELGVGIAGGGNLGFFNNGHHFGGASRAVFITALGGLTHALVQHEGQGIEHIAKPSARLGRTGRERRAEALLRACVSRAEELPCSCEDGLLVIVTQEFAGRTARKAQQLGFLQVGHLL